MTFLLSGALILGACQPTGQDGTQLDESDRLLMTPTITIDPNATPLPTRAVFEPGFLVDYTAQAGDSLFALAAHFNTEVDEILAANPIIPPGVTTLPPGMPMKIPIYYSAFLGTPFKILPDELFINGPAQIDFDASEFVMDTTGWLKNFRAYAAGAHRSGAEIVDYVATNFSVSPRVLLAVVEYLAGGLSQPELEAENRLYPLKYEDRFHQGFYLQLVWVANTLNNGYYGWRTGTLTSFDRLDGRTEIPDPWQNAGSVGLQYLFSRLFAPDGYDHAISASGFAAVYSSYFGDPWEDSSPHILGSLEQPEFILPFPSGNVWAYTGGPHTAWGEGAPLAALDFAPPGTLGGCELSTEWTVAIAPGIVSRTGPGIIVLDLDGDGDERTGWAIFYFHVATEEKVLEGTSLQRGDPIGHPSCEGGRTTGTHVHIARKYNGEWIPADSYLPFEMEGWVPRNGDQEYAGELVRYESVVIACDCANQTSLIEAKWGESEE